MTIQRLGYNNLTVSAYARNSTTPVSDHGELRLAQGIRFDLFYPGGRYGECTLFIPRDVRKSWQLAGAQRVVVRNGLFVVYEGYISSFGYDVGETSQGVQIACVGAWGEILGRLALDKRWADTRTDPSVWRWLPDSLEAANNQFLAYAGPDNRLKIIPKKEAWANGDYIYIKYAMPVGQTIKKVVCVLTLAEGGQAWEISLWRSTDDVTYTQMTAASGETYALGTTTVITANGSTTISVTLGTASRYLQIRFYARGAQTPTDEKNTIYGEVTSLAVYSETSSINLTEIAKDVRVSTADLNTDESQITTAATYALSFVTNGPEWATDILARAASYGDSSQNSYACYLVDSDQAATPDGKPVLVVEQQPALTDYDYAISLEDPNLIPPLNIVKDFSGVRNYYWVRHRDPLFDAAANREFIQTPVDDATLKDTTSITAYGQRDEQVNAGQVNSTIAINMAKRRLALTKDPRLYVDAPITVQGYVLSKTNQPVPASQILPGKRLKIINFLNDEVAPSGVGLTFIINSVHYDDEIEKATISCGVPNDLAVLLAQMALESERASA